MARARQEAEWARTAEVLALLYNTRLFGDGEALTADDFNPFADPAVQALAPEPDTGAGFAALKEALGGE